MAAPGPPPPLPNLDEGGDIKYFVVSSGTSSGLGKGTATSSIGVLLRSYGLRVTALKVDPYLNVDNSTMNVFEHGEVYVLSDGGETDLDLGNYERFMDLTLTSGHHITSGKIFEQVIKRERLGESLGKKVCMVPHVTDAIQDWITDIARRPVDRSGQRPQVCLIELGGTVGDIEMAVYLEALQQLMFKVGPDNFLMAHVAMVPVMGATGEQKTKPCQQSVKLLREAGLKPDVLLCRSEQSLEDMTRRKLSVFCQVPQEAVISLHDISNIYRVPILLHEQRLGDFICRRFGFDPSAVANTLQFEDAALNSILGMPGTPSRDERLSDWRSVAERVDSCVDEVSIAIVGKYTGLHDTYISVIKALKHATVEAGLHLSIDWVDSSDLEPNAQQLDHRRFDAAWWRLKNAHGVLVPSTGGDRSIEGKVWATQFCRTSNTPYLGIGVGLHAAVIEFARSELGWESANSTEYDESTAHPVVVFMPEAAATVLGGTMRLGSRTSYIKENTLAYKIYGGQKMISERHRHRYEVNTACVGVLEQKGMRFTGQDERQQRMEIMEIPSHPFFLGTSFQPEFQSRPSVPSPPFLGFILAAAKRLERRLEEDKGLLRPGAGFEPR